MIYPKYQIAFGGGSSIESAIQLQQSPNEIVFISIEQDNPLIYFLGSKKFIVNLVQPSHYIPLSVSLSPNYSTIIASIKQMLTEFK